MINQNPLDQFEIRDLLSMHAFALANYLSSLANSVWDMLEKYILALFTSLDDLTSLLLFSTMCTVLTTITFLIIQRFISTLNQYNNSQNMRYKRKISVDLAFCVVRPQTLVDINGRKLRVLKQAVFVYSTLPGIPWRHIILDNLVVGVRAYVLNEGPLKVGTWASVNIDGTPYTGYLYINGIPDDISFWQTVFIGVNETQINDTCDITTMGFPVRRITTIPATRGLPISLIAARSVSRPCVGIRNSYKIPRNVPIIKSHL